MSPARRFGARILPLGFLLALGQMIVACGPPAPPEARVDLPLLDADHELDILVAKRRLALPPATSGNRFLSGWWPIRQGGAVQLVPLEGGARLEVVRLRAVPLRLDLLATLAPERGVRARAGGRDLTLERTPTGLTIALPADLPLGRTAVDLFFDPSPEPSFVAGGGVRPVGQRGTAQRSGNDLCQEGDSIVDLVRHVPPRARLHGRFDAIGGAHERFALQIQDEAGKETTIEVPNGDAVRLDVDLGGRHGLIRFRFLALGDQAEGCWRDLFLNLPEPSQGPPTEPADRRPSRDAQPPRLVLLYVMDALRADHLGHLAGRSDLSPQIDRFAAAGTTFTEHRSVAPNTLPSSKALLIGRAFVDRGGWKLAPDDGPTLAELFRQAGYRTALISANGYVGPAFGTDRGFDFVDTSTQFDDRDASRTNDSARQVHRAARAWLETIDPVEPVFLYLHTLNPHNPYEPPEPFPERFASDMSSTVDGTTNTLLDIQHARMEPDAEDIRRLRALYAASVAFNDTEIGELTAFLEQRYAPEDSLFAFTSDHGEELFEHDGVLHGYTLYREMLHIPLVLWSPNRVDIGRVQAPTDTLDLFATLLELAGIPVPASAQGRSLRGFLGGSPASPRSEPGIRFASAASVPGGIFSAETRGLKLIWAPRTGTEWGLGSGRGRTRDIEYFFDLATDPAETRNQAGSDALAAAWLRGRLFAWVKQGRRAEASDEPPAIDPETRRHLEALGYAN